MSKVGNKVDNDDRNLKGGFGANFVTLGDDRIEFNGKNLKSFTMEGAVLRIANNIPKTPGVTFSPDYSQVQVNGLKIERAKDGKIIVTGPPGTTLKDYPALTPGDQMQPGEKREDGTIYLGISRSSQANDLAVCKDIFVSGSVLRGPDGDLFIQRPRIVLEQLKKYKGHGHDDWTLGDQEVLKEQFNQRRTGHFDGTYQEIGYDVRNIVYMGGPAIYGGKPGVVAQSFYERGGSGSTDINSTTGILARPVRFEPRESCPS